MGLKRPNHKTLYLEDLKAILAYGAENGYIEMSKTLSKLFGKGYYVEVKI